MEVASRLKMTYSISLISQCFVVNAATQAAGDAYHLKEETETLRQAVYETHWLHYFTSINKALDMTRAEYGL